MHVNDIFVIPLTKGKVSIVDKNTYDACKHFKWHVAGKNYAARTVRKNGKKYYEYLHRKAVEINGLNPNGLDVDHVDGDRLNNTFSNLRICTRSQNLLNSSRHKDNFSGYKGVSVYGTKFVARLTVNNKNLHLGVFDSAEKAHQAYASAVLKYRDTNFTRLN